MAFRVIATGHFATQLRNAPGELAGYVSAVTAVLRVDPTVASAAFDVADQVSRLYELIAGYHATNLLEVTRELGVWEALAQRPGPDLRGARDPARHPAVLHRRAVSSFCLACAPR